MDKFKCGLIVLFVGALVWLVRKVVPAKYEKAVWFQKLLRIGPVFIGTGVACIPALSPTGDMFTSALCGFIGGSLSQTSYTVLRAIAPEKIKQFLGGKQEKE